MYMPFFGSGRCSEGAWRRKCLGNNYVVWIFRVSLSRRIILSNGNSHQNALTCKDSHNQMDKLVWSEILSHSSMCFSKWLYKQRKQWDQKGHMQGLLAWLTWLPPLLKTSLASVSDQPQPWSITVLQVSHQPGDSRWTPCIMLFVLTKNDIF